MKYFPQKSARVLRQFIVIALATVLAGNTLIAPVFAVGLNDLHSITTNTPFYNPADTQCIGAGGVTELVGSDPEDKAFNFLIGKDLSPIATAGIVGNLMEESLGVNPRIVQGDSSHPTTYSDTIPYYAMGKLGYGIAQWTNEQRQKDLIAWAARANKPVSDLGVQLDFLWSEATGTYKDTLEKTKTAGTIADATETWMKGFESPDPAKAHLDDVRIPDAQKAYDRYIKEQGATSADIALTNETCGMSTNFADNFIIYKQCDTYTSYSESAAEKQAAHQWSNAPYGDGTVCGSGCGPTAMAMIITNLTGNQNATPDKIAAFGFKNGTGSGWGSDGNALIKVFGTSKWGIKGTPIDAVGADPAHNQPGVGDIQKINDTLRRGGLVLMRGHMDNDFDEQKAKPWPGPFSVPGHFVVIRAITSDGKWLIGNPGGWSDKASYDPEWIYAHTTVHDSWAIYKE